MVFDLNLIMTQLHIVETLKVFRYDWHFKMVKTHRDWLGGCNVKTIVVAA